MARRDTNGNANGSGGGAGSRSASNSAFARTSFLEVATPLMSNNSKIAICAIPPLSTPRGANSSRR